MQATPALRIIALLTIALGATPRGLCAETGDELHAIGPPLTALHRKIADPRWLVAWLLKPSHLHQRARMRRFNISIAEAQAMARYLYSPLPSARRAGRWQGGDARQGEALFVTRGCRGCHAVAPADPPPLPRAPHLSGIGIKVRGDWLFSWLQAPRTYDPDTPMPQLVLNDDEIRHLVAFLLAQRQGADVLSAAPPFDAQRDLEEGRRAIARFDCAKCHLIDGFQTVAPTRGPAFVPRLCANCHEPGGSRVTDRTTAPPESLETGRLLVEVYGCRGCHRLEGRGGAIAEFFERKSFAPPTLEGEGARVQTSWLVEFLQRPSVLRPWLQVRMPTYSFSPAEATALAQYMAALAQVPAADEAWVAATAGSSALGQRRFAHYKCAQCHPMRSGTQIPEGLDPEDVSINLTLAKSRLRPSWIHDFLARPKAVVGNDTRMPAVFYTSDGLPKVDRPDEDIAAITAALRELTDTAAAPPAESTSTPQSEPIDWAHVPY